MNDLTMRAIFSAAAAGRVRDMSFLVESAGIHENDRCARMDVHDPMIGMSTMWVPGTLR